jgi:membrane-bound serine protease (ClpP class)
LVFHANPSIVRFAVLVAAFVAVTAAGHAAPVVDVVHVNGVIGPATARYVLRALDRAEYHRVQALVLEMDTPGGLTKSMDDISEGLLNSPVPSVAYVYPSGARAASAGVFIMYAAGLAAMAPTTHLGAAHPVSIATTGTGSMDKTEMTKATNDAVAEIRSFALRHGRNGVWAERAVRQSVSITSEEALRLHVIDLIATGPSDLLAKLDGRLVRTATGTVRLQTRNAHLIDVAMDLTEEFLRLLSDPNVGFVLMTIAIYGIIFELSNPGLIFPGVIGVFALLLALASFAIIEVNAAGVIFIVFAIALFIADIKVPSHGILTAGGITSFVLGSLLLTSNQAPFLRVSIALIIGVAVMTAAFFLFAVGAGVRAQGRRVETGREALVGAIGVVRRELAPEGTVFVQGELWSAASSSGMIPAGARVRVVAINGLHLKVRAVDESL